MIQSVKNKVLQSLQKERMGLSLVACALLVVMGISVMMAFYLSQYQQTQNRTQGLSLTRLVAEIPFDKLASIKTKNTLKNIFYSNLQSDLAYILLTDLSGARVSEVSNAGVLAPQLSVSMEPTQWKGERELQLNGSTIIEFYAPIFTGSEHKGFVSVGYFLPSYLSLSQFVPYIATIVLPVFLLTPIFYGLMRREVKPLVSAHNDISDHFNSMKNNPIEISADGELSDFVGNFNEYFGQLRRQIEYLEVEKTQSQVNEKIVAYNFNRFEQLLDQLPDAVLALDELGSPIFSNARMQSLLHVTQDQILNSPVQEWCNELPLREFVQRCQKNGQVTQDTLKLSLSDGPVTLLSVKSVPVYDDIDGASQFVGSMIVMKDDSALAQMQESRDHFIAHVSHELKTPLNTLAMYSESLLGAENNDPEFKAEALNVIHDETERMSELINNLLSITQLETGGMNIDRHRVKMNEFIQDIFDNVSKSDASQSIDFVLEMPSVVSSVAIDKNLMRIAINNLLTNAIKYNRENGRVTLKVEELNDQIKLSVSDTGIGIKIEDQPKVFDKFFRSEEEGVRERSGHGLGLTLTRDIINLHGGRISVTSEPEQGTEFTIEFQKESNLLKWAS